MYLINFTVFSIRGMSTLFRTTKIPELVNAEFMDADVLVY